MGKLGTNFKVCQTCRFWSGMRDINGMAKLVDSISDKGKCVNPKGFYNQDMNKLATCSHHESVI